MDAVCLDDWELLPDQTSSFPMEECGNGHGGNKGQLLLGAKLVMVDMDHFAAAAASHRGPSYGCVVLDEEAKKPLLLPSSRGILHGSVVAPVVTEFKDIGVVVQTEPKRAVAEATSSKATEVLIPDDAEGEEGEAIKFPDAVKEVVVQNDEVLAEAAAAAPGDWFAGEDDNGDEGAMKIGNLRVHGVGALCSFGVAAATFCVLLLGGKQQQGRQNRHKIQLQMYADDQRIQRVTQQASRLNQPISARASISFGGHYHGFR